MTSCIHLAFAARFTPLHAASPRSCQHSKVCRMDNLLHAESPGRFTASVQVENREISAKLRDGSQPKLISSVRCRGASECEPETNRTDP